MRVHEVPPNGQGIAALLALNILKEMGVTEANSSSIGVGVGVGEGGAAAGVQGEEGEAAYLHRLIEALRLSFADTRWYCADMDKVYVPVERLLGQSYAAERARLFDASRWVRIVEV